MIGFGIPFMSAVTWLDLVEERPDLTGVTVAADGPLQVVAGAKGPTLAGRKITRTLASDAAAARARRRSSAAGRS